MNKSQPISSSTPDSNLMHRCHYCGKILHELPYTCRRCGNIFCSDHHLPENHRCSRHHHHDHKPTHKYCGNCGRELSGMPYTCHRCGVALCDHCRLPENHGCKVSPNIPGQTPVTPPKKTPTRNYDWKKIWEQLTLKNFTTVSIFFILIGLIPIIYSQNNFISFFRGFFEIGIICFILAYFLYAVKCWGENNQGYGFLMVTIPLLVYFLTTSKIPELTTNILFYLFIQLCFYGILAVILLYISDKVKMGIESHLFRRTRRPHWYFIPKLSYVLAGFVIVSLLVINYGSISLLYDNSNTISQSLQKIISPAHTTSASDLVPISTIAQNTRIVPTLQPEIVKSIESTVGNSAPVIDIPTLEGRVHELINQQRKSNGLSSLSYDSSLASIARKHSADMARNNYFSHYNLQGLDPTDRGTQAGYSCYKNYGSYYTTGIAENIMQNNLYNSITTYNGIPRYAWNSQEEIAQSTVSGWMSSTGHRKNILTSTYDREGIGVAIAADDKVYITQDFC